jgi:prepilin-type N-terminal cleavage/methylation domain-containing protein
VSNDRTNNKALCLARTTREKLERQNTMQIKQNRKSGFTLVEIMIVVAIIGLLAAIAIPNFVRARSTSQANSCINNMRQIDGAVQQYALEQNKKTGDAAPGWAKGVAPVTGVADYIKLNKNSVVPGCPLGDPTKDGDSLTIATIGAIPQVTCANATLVPAHVMP